MCSRSVSRELIEECKPKERNGKPKRVRDTVLARSKNEMKERNGSHDGDDEVRAMRLSRRGRGGECGKKR